jgi:hypothetical protein
VTCHPTEPCEKCPYRRDAPIGLWVKDHYELVIKIDQPFGGIFMCHKDKENKEKMCAGWLLDQKNRRVPNMMLRLKLMREPDALEALEAVNDGGHEMFDSAQEMAEFNIEHGVFDDD